MADVQFDISLKNTGSGTEGLTLFAPVMATSQKANKYAFSTPYAATYPAGTVFTILDDNGSSIVTLNSEMTMAQVILLLNALNIGTFILAYNDITNGNVFHLLSVRNPQTFSIDNNIYSGTFTLVDTESVYGPIALIGSQRVIIGTPGPDVLLSIDGGLSYNIVSLPGGPVDANITTIQFINSLEGFLLIKTLGKVNYIYKTNDAGDSWTLVQTYANTQYNSLWMFDSNNGLLTGLDAAEDERVMFTSNGGISLTGGSLIAPAGAGKLQFINSNVGFIYNMENSARIVLRTTNGGVTWLSAAVSEQIYAGFALDENNVYVVGENGMIEYSNDGGATFNSINSSTTSLIYSIHVFSAQHIIIGRINGYYSTTINGGITWEDTYIGATGNINLIFYDQYYGVAHNYGSNIYKYS